MNDLAVIGIGNVLQKDDGFGVYISIYLESNFVFSKNINFINGGVEGIGLLNELYSNKNVLILDAIELSDESGSVYVIPAYELTGYGINSGGAHEIGVVQCLDILELQGKQIPNTIIIGIIPDIITFNIGLSEKLSLCAEAYIKVVLNEIEKFGITYRKKDNQVDICEIIQKIKYPS